MAKPSRFALVFDGQSGVKPEHLIKALCCPQVKERVVCASSLLGRDLFALASAQEPAVLNSTAVHSLHFSISIGLFDALRARGFKPTVVAGYSLGEFATIVATEVISFEKALLIVEGRAKLIAMATEQLDGLTVNLRGDARVLEQVPSLLTHGVTIAAFNSSQSLNLTGPREAVLRVVGLVERLPVRVRILPFPAISHSPLLKNFVARLDSYLRQAQPYYSPSVQVINATTGTLVKTYGGAFRNLLKHQLVNPVQWVKVVERLRELEEPEILEIGVNPYLGRGIKTDWPEATVLPVSDQESLEAAVAAIS